MRVELHCHTHRSRDSLMLPERLLQACLRRRVDRIAITDHNTIAGALEAVLLDPERVIIGEEIMTTQGELLGYFMKQEIPPGLTPAEAIRRLRSQDALISVAHPFDRSRPGGWDEAALRAILPEVDALEVFNARTWSSAANRRGGPLAAGARGPGAGAARGRRPTKAPARPQRVLFVCHANLIRSPLAENLFRKMTSRAGLEGRFEVDSARGAVRAER